MSTEPGKVEGMDRRYLMQLVAAGAISGGLIGHLLARGIWEWALVVAVVWLAWMLYQDSYEAAWRRGRAQRKREARKAGVCWRCGIPGKNHRNIDVCADAFYMEPEGSGDGTR